MTHNRLNGQDAGTPPQESHGASVDQFFEDLLEASSLGSPAARQIRSSTPSQVVDDVRRRREHHRELSLRRRLSRTLRGRRISAQIAIRSLAAERARADDWSAAYRDVQAQKADRLRAQHAGLRDWGPGRDADLSTHAGNRQEAAVNLPLPRDPAAQRTHETVLVPRKHERLPRWASRLPGLVLLFDFCLLVYFFAGITNVNWASPFSAALVFAILLTAMVTTLSYGFLAFTGHRLRGYKDHSGRIATSDLDGLTRTACAAAAAGITVIAALMFIRMRTEMLYAFGPKGRFTALMIALVLAVVSLLANFLVVTIRALDGSDATARVEALGAAVSGRLAMQCIHMRAANPMLAADQIIDAARAIHQGADPLRESAITTDGKEGVVGYRRARDKSAVDKRGTRRASSSNRRLAAGKLTGAVALVAVAVIAIVVAVAATTSGLGFSRFASASSPGTRMVIAATATANEPAPALPADILQTLRSAGTSSKGATAYIVSPSDRQLSALSLTPQTGDALARSSALETKVAAVQRMLENEAAPGQLDLLATMATATRATSSPATLIVLSSGLSTAGGFDLRQVGWDANASSLAEQLKARRQLPDLNGWGVVFSGLGDVSGRQPDLPLPQQTALVDYWMAICRASGAASCSVDKTVRPQLASHTTNPVPVVPVPVMAAATVPASLLFQSNSAAVISYADKILRPIAQRARSQHLLVSITGYASPDGGTTAYNSALSLQRAQTVRDRLIELGVPAGQITQVTGVGTAGQSLGACLVHGHLDEALCAQLRRVVIILSPAKGNS